MAFKSISSIAIAVCAASGTTCAQGLAPTSNNNTCDNDYYRLRNQQQCAIEAQYSETARSRHSPILKLDSSGKLRNPDGSVSTASPGYSEPLKTKK